MTLILTNGCNVLRKWSLAAPVVASLLFSSCNADQNVTSKTDTAVLTQTSQTVAQVSSSTISARELHYRIGIAAAYGTTVERPAALVALIKDALEYEVASAVALIPSQDEMKSFSEQVDKSTKAPEVLAAVKQVFGSDVDAYHRIYLSPKIINRKLRAWYSRNAELHQQQRDSIQQAWTLVHHGQGFEQVAEKAGLTYKTQEYGGETKATPDALKSHFPEGFVSMSDSFRKLLDATQVGEIVSTIVENDYSYRIIRLVRKHDGVYHTEEISVAKASFFKWFDRESEQVKIQVFDDTLKQSIQTGYPNIAWVKRL